MSAHEELRQRCLTHAELPPDYTGNFQEIARVASRARDREQIEQIAFSMARYIDALQKASDEYEQIGVLRKQDGEFTTYEFCEGEPVYVKKWTE